MNRRVISRLGLVAAAVAIAGCSDSTNPSVNTVTDAQIATDIANTTGEAIANDVAELTVDDIAAPAPAFDIENGPGLNVVRSRTCFTGGQAAACDAQLTDSIQLSIQIDGSVSRTNTTPHGTESMSSAFHRTRSVSITGLTGSESSRTHNAVGAGSDTTSFSGTTDSTSRSRTLTTAGTDSVVGLVFTLPHANHPWPTAGQIIRNVSGKVVITGPNAGERSFSRRVVVTFPADAQGNVEIDINAKMCQLNLTTHAVTNCSN